MGAGPLFLQINEDFGSVPTCIYDLFVTAIADSIKRGDILLSEFDGIDHRKFFVVMGVSEDKICGFFFINSNIHPAIFNAIIGAWPE